MAKALSKGVGYSLVDPNELVKNEKLYTCFDRTSKSYVVDEDRLRRRLQDLSRGSEKKIALPTHLVGRALPGASVKLALVLRLDPLTLFRRLRARGWTKKKALENVEAEILDTCLQESLTLLGRRRIYEIDTTGRTRVSVYREALRALAKGASRSGEVNWLATHDPIELRRRL